MAEIQHEQKVVVALSGGVDSSVAAGLLVEAGYEVIGMHFRLPVLGRLDESAPRPDHAADARRMADAAGIELVVREVDLSGVVDYFVSEYARGRTPNPCVRCNATVKFAELLGLADERGAGFVATGHHARAETVEGVPAILRGRAAGKDQSYALSALPREYLGRIIFPVGSVESKGRVRDVARRLGLEVHDKAESQEICFLAGDYYVNLLAELAPDALRAGPIVDASGRELARHNGFARFTIGQRRGLRFAAGKPMYVTHIDAKTAVVTVGPRDELLAEQLTASGASWQADVAEQFDALVQIRYNHTAVPGRVRITGADSFEVRFAEPVPAVTPGQAAVIYAGDRLLGGGWID